MKRMKKGAHNTLNMEAYSSFVQNLQNQEKTPTSVT